MLESGRQVGIKRECGGKDVAKATPGPSNPALPGLPGIMA
jgi:hypothetical protein